MRRSDKPWAAGFFEGEGCVRIDKPNSHGWGMLQVEISNTDKECLNFFQERWGGSICGMHVTKNHKPSWKWRLTTKQAVPFLKDIRPYIRRTHIRRKIQVALRFQKQKMHRRGGVHWGSYWKKQLGFYQQMRILNRKGPAHGKEFCLA